MVQPGLTGVGSRELAERAGLSKERYQAMVYCYCCCWAILGWLWFRAVVILGGDFYFPPPPHFVEPFRLGLGCFFLGPLAVSSGGGVYSPNAMKLTINWGSLILVSLFFVVLFFFPEGFCFFVSLCLLAVLR